MVRDNCGGCEAKTERLTAAEGCIANLKYNWNLAREHMTKREDLIEQDLKNKLSATTFYKILSVLVAILIVVIGANWSLMFNIDAKVDEIDKNQGVVLEKLNHINRK